ncbi:efflux RND transporter periplasmic adaptor subunit [Botrimarina mediterranea]|uniref:Cation efflux system protein CusB n=1 Tax=Botrimarina mediterranea TaxID=2528022 RepID=A0A518K8D4_9BACT|nr:efflux RND transporter periplasmic adaptor subunit [Botrimarina mediterranea]QDV74058.1 Cation efflux system protein CusB precursor [Botrimarina mediterranea]QDV78688.1 Cation efflux system protein CusB precursor [Planctomycetes bacterium K2D]
MSSQPSLLFAFAAASLSAVAYAQPPGAPPPGVVIAPVESRTVAASQTFVGTVQPLRRATIGSAVAGRVVEFPVNQGDRVEAGQTLAQLLTDTINLELDAAKAELELRRQRLAELRNGLRPEEIAQARARMAAAQARRDFANARSSRVEKVYHQQQVITDDEYEEAIALAAEAEGAYLEAKAAYDLAVAGNRKEVIAQAAAEVAMQEAVTERLADQLTKHTIISRFAGYVVTESTEEGQWVNQGDPVAEVIAVDEVEVVAQVVEQSIPFVMPGSEVNIEVPALKGRFFVGRVSEIIPQGDERSRTFPVKIVVTNEITDAGPVLKPGMYARVRLPIGAEQQATMAPKDAIVLGGAQPMVYVVDGDTRQGGEGKVTPVPVKLGVAVGALIEVDGALESGQFVVVEGNERLRPGQAIRIGSVNEPAAAFAVDGPTAPLKATSR